MSEQSPFILPREPEFHRLLPANADAEKALLGSFMVLPAEVGGLLAENGLTEAKYSVPAHGIIHRVLMERWANQAAIDPIALTEDLIVRNLLEIAGGRVFISHLFGFMPTAANARHYMEIVQEKHALREMIRLCTEFTTRAYEEQDDLDGLRAELEQRVLAFGDARGEDEVSFKTHVLGSITRAEQAFERRGSLLGMSCGLKSLDDLISGLCDTDYIVISGETGGGKTGLLLRFLEAVAVGQQQPAGLFSFEMTNDQVTDRMLSGNSRVDLHKYRNGGFSDHDYTRVEVSATRMSPAKILLCDQSEINIMQLRAKARRWKRKHGIRFIGVDYAQLVPPTPVKGSRNREQEVAEISRNLKAMAKELKLPVVVLSQLNDDGKVRESRALAHDANIVLAVQCEDIDTPKERHYIKICKNRNGPRGRVKVAFLKQFARFEECAQDPDESPEDTKPPTKYQSQPHRNTREK